MIFSRKLLRKVGRGCRKNKLPRLASRRELVFPAHFVCPISLDLMRDPVMLPTGVTYDRENIEKWLWAGHNACPVTNQALDANHDRVVVPNHAMRKAIQDWCVDNKSYGVERIPTPKVPLSPSEVSEICAWFEAAIGRRDNDECLRLLGRVKGFAKESERNKKCLRDSRLSGVLSACFDAFASVSTAVPSTSHADLLKKLLSALTWMFRAGEDTTSTLGSETSLRCMARVLKGDDPPARQNVVVVLKKLFSTDPSFAKVLTEADDEVPEALIEMLKYPECPSAMKTLLVVMHHVVLSSTPEACRGKLVRLGLGHLLIEIVIDAEKGNDEKALTILDVLCDSQEGREGICDHSLTMPLLVKKILRISEVCSELCVSILWKLCKNGNNYNERAIIEALELGVFQKLLILLQVGCGEATKEKANELLKLMNAYRVRVPCLHTSTGFKYMEKSY